MRKCKSGPFWNDNNQRFLANNSAVYNKKPSDEEFMEEWLSLIKSRSGERGIFNRQSLSNLPSRRLKSLGDNLKYMGTNPCGEIILRPFGLCNLTTIVCRPQDTEKDLLRKIRLAAILGTYQSTLTNINYVNPLYKKNAEEERLLGVSMTGQFDCPAVRNKETLSKLKNEAVAVNAQYAKILDIPASLAVTAVKPEGTVSEMVGAASGMHARFSKYYIRRVRINATDPLCQMMKEQGVPWDPENGQSTNNHNTAVFRFPVASPKQAITRDDVKALDMLDYWRILKQYYCEHNPSVTVDVGQDEWIDCQQWIMKNWSLVGGISFLPRSDHVYTLAPFEKITEEQYNKMPKVTVDYGKIIYYEKEDKTDRKGELACAGKDGCSL
jgi:ribonucleoside-diphosphate reductase alpha chain